MHRVRFHDRDEAGKVLAVQLAHYAGRSGTVVLGLPRGGVAVAYPVARTLSAPLDVLLVRELSVPERELGASEAAPSLAPGIVASGGVRVVNPAVVDRLGIEPEDLDRATTEASLELTRLEHTYHAAHDRLDLRGQIAIIVDDGVDGASPMRSAIAAVRQQGADRVVVAVPVASSASCRELSALADEVVWVVSADSLASVASWYDDFSPVNDAQVRDLLDRGREDARIAQLAGWQRSSAPSFTSLSPERF